MSQHSLQARILQELKQADGELELEELHQRIQAAQ
jgi:hypothetical protein